MSSQFKPLQIPPGVVAMPTKNMSSSNWAEVNLMRWIEGELQPMGGMSQYQFYDSQGDSFTQFASRCKAIHGWYDLQSNYWIAYVCETNVYVETPTVGDSGTIYEITPAGGWPPPTPPGEGGYGDDVYGVDNYGTPRAENTILNVDVLPPMWSVDNFGAVLLVQYSEDGRLLQWDPGAGQVGWVVGVGATTGWSVGATTIPLTGNPGSAVVPGMNVAIGPAPYIDVGTVLSVDSGSVTLTTGAVTAGPGGSTLFFGNVLQPIRSSQAAPWIIPQGRGFVVTPQEFVIMFGTTIDGTTGGGFQWRFAWCDQGDYTNWNYASVTNQAGYLDISPASPIVTASAGRFGVLMFTGKKAYNVAYQGLPYVWSSVELGDNCTPWSPLSITPTSTYQLWMSDQGVFSFDGAVISPVQCSVRKWVTDSVDWVNVRDQAFAFHNAVYNEFWWFFPVTQAIDADNFGTNTRCVIYNYKEGWWAQGKLSRSAGVTSSYTVQPILANGLIAYEHEVGLAYSPDCTPPYAETFDLNIAAGTRLTTLKQIIPDISGDWSNIQFEFYAGISRSILPDSMLHGCWSPPSTINNKGYVDVRQTGRDIRMRISMIGLNTAAWTMGQHLYDAVPRGDR